MGDSSPICACAGAVAMHQCHAGTSYPFAHAWGASDPFAHVRGCRGPLVPAARLHMRMGASVCILGTHDLLVHACVLAPCAHPFVHAHLVLHISLLLPFLLGHQTGKVGGLCFTVSSDWILAAQRW